VQLGQDQYGNYVIQHVVEQGKPHERDAVYERLFPHIVVLSQNKFASNVVEKMLLHCTPAQRGAIVEEFLRQPSRRWVDCRLVCLRLACCLREPSLRWITCCADHLHSCLPGFLAIC
jgi:hypothetical protein